MSTGASSQLGARRRHWRPVIDPEREAELLQALVAANPAALGARLRSIFCRARRAQAGGSRAAHSFGARRVA